MVEGVVPCDGLKTRGRLLSKQREWQRRCSDVALDGDSTRNSRARKEGKEREGQGWKAGAQAELSS